MYRHTASPVSLWPKVSGLRSGHPSSNLSVSLRSTRPGCGSQRLLRCRLHPAGRGPNSDSLFPPLAAVVAVAPGRGASGEEAKLCGMPRPPLARGGGTASAVTERLSPAAAHGQAVLRPTSQSHFVRQGRVAAPSVCFAVACILLAAAPTATPCFRRWRRSSPLPLVGEPLAKRQSFAECQGLPSLGEVASRKR